LGGQEKCNVETTNQVGCQTKTGVSVREVSHLFQEGDREWKGSGNLPIQKSYMGENDMN